MTEYRWMPWFFSNNPDPDDFNNVANWAQIIPTGGARLPAAAPPGASDLVVFGNPAFQFPGTPSGNITGTATVDEIEFDQVSNPPPSGWFINGNLTATTLLPLSGGTIHVAGSLTVTGNVASTAQPATVELDGSGSLELDGTTGAVSVGFTAANQSLTLKGASASSPITITVQNFQAGDSIVLPGTLTSSAEFGAEGELDVYSGIAKVATINFGNGIDQATIVPHADGSNTTLIADPLPFNPLSDPPGNKVDWQFIHNNEAPGGIEVLAPYIPGYADPKNMSGVTIGLGVDFGGSLITTATLATLFTPDWTNNPNLKFLWDAHGDKGPDAVAALNEGATKPNKGNLGSISVSLTESEANALSSAAEAATYSDLVSAYNAASGTLFTSLQPGEQTAIMDMAFNFGLSTVRPGLRSYQFWSQATQNTAAGWEQAYDNLLLWGGPASLYPRRIAEAKLIGQYVTNPRLTPDDIPAFTKKDGTSTYRFADVKNAYYHLDPVGSAAYTLTEDAGSPLFASIILPAADAVGYSIQYESGTTWSAPQIASPLQEIIFPQNANAIQVTLLDAHGAPIANPTDFSFFVSFASDGAFSGTVTEPTASCFGKGTMIATSLGPRPVEALRVGDLVLVERPGKKRGLEAIRWVGHRRMHFSSRSDAVLNAPVRIRAGAIAPNRPSRDLILSPDHCIYVDGHLLRAYRLINGVSVVQEFPRAIDYYHIEIENHGLVFAQGLAVETYLEEECPIFFPSRYARPNRQRDKVRQTACAPSAPDDGFAERAWRAVAERAGVDMLETRRAPKPDVTLIAGSRRIRPTVHRKDRITFALPPGCSDIRLLSSAARPTEARPWLEDRRLLGMNVRNLRMDAGDALPLDSDAIGQGWWPIEPGLSRWTDGDACVRLPATARLLDVLLRA